VEFERFEDEVDEPPPIFQFGTAGELEELKQN
jgi:hypothetical protein